MSLDQPDAGVTPSLLRVLDTLEGAAPFVVQMAVDAFYAVYPDLHLAHGYEGVRHWRDDADRHLQALIAALRSGDAPSFAGYARSYADDLRAQGRDAAAFARLLEIIGQTIRERMGDPVWDQVRPALDAALRAILEQTESVIVTPSNPRRITSAYLDAVLVGNRVAAQDLVFRAMDAGATIRQVYLDVFQPALYEVGRMWETGKLSVAQEHLATAITQAILSGMYARVALPPAGQQRAVVACLAGNYHEIGPRMIADFLQMAGYDTRFLGANTPVDSLLDMIDRIRPAVVGLPSTTEAQIEQVRQTIDRIRADFASYRPTIMVGGLAFNFVDGLWQRVGGDVWGADAGQAIDQLVGSTDW